MSIDFKGGLLPQQPAKPRLRISDHFPDLTKGGNPQTVDWLSKVPSYPMYLNNQIGDCVTPETLVLTESLEWVTAGSLQPGDKLLGFEEEPTRVDKRGRPRGRWFSPSVVEKADKIFRPCYELEFDDGTVVRSSSGHRWLTHSTEQGSLKVQIWQKTEDLRSEAPRQTEVVKPLETWTEDSSWDSGYLAAAFDGEGHLEQVARANRVAFNQTSNEMLPQVELSLKELGFAYHHEIHNRNKLLRIDGSPRKEMHTLRIGNRRDFLHFMGRVRPRRLLAKYDITSLGRIPKDTVRLVRKTFIGEQEVVMLDTSSRTYFANGLASHNCTIAMTGHQIEAWTEYGQGTAHKVTNSQVLTAYEAVSGYVPGEPNTDQGAVLQDVMNYWRKTGIGGHKIVAFAQVNVANLIEAHSAINYFGSLSVGVNFPNAAMDQFNHHQVWSPVKGDTIAGGHAIHVGAYSHPNNTLTAVTWGAPQVLTYPWWVEYVQEAWVAITQDWINKASQVDPLKQGLTTLEQEFKQLTGQAGFNAAV